MGFHRGTWAWLAVSAAGDVMHRGMGCRVADLEKTGIIQFRVEPRVLLAPLSLHRAGGVAQRDHGLTLERNVLKIGKHAKGLRFTRRQSGVVGGPITDEEILVRYTWGPSGRRILAHIRPGQVLVSEDAA